MAHRAKRMAERYSRVLLLFGVALAARLVGCLASDSALFIMICNAVCNLTLTGLFFWWLLSMRERMTQQNLYRYIRSSVLLILTLLLTRITRYDFWSEQNALPRFLWYFYYLAIIFLPLLNLFAALCVGREEEYRVPGKLKLLYFAGLLLFLCVMTNDFHQLVFRFHSEPFSENNCSYGPVYYVIAAWVVVLMLLFIGLLVQRCMLANSIRRAVPALVVAAFGAGLLGLNVLLRGTALYWYVNLLDIMLTLCVCDAAIWEACIATGLVVSNSRFGALFAKSTLQAQILDYDGRVCFAAERALPLTPQQVAQAGKAPLMLDENTRLNLSPIGGGSVLWTEDLTDVNRMIRKIEAAGASLSESNRALSKENEIKRRLSEVREQNRLYGKITAAVSDDLQQLRELLETIDRGADAREGFSRVCVRSAYLKRKINLLLLAESNRTLPARELEYAVRESLHYAALCGLKAQLIAFPEMQVASGLLVAAYDRFALQLEGALRSPGPVLVKLIQTGAAVSVALLPPADGKAGEGAYA